MTSKFDYLYIHSFSVNYNTNPNDKILSFPLIFPDTVTVPANSLLNIDMKLKVNLFCPCIPSFSRAALISPSAELINTPLVYALPGSLVYNNGYSTDIHIPVRNISNVDYEITSGTSLFNITTQSGELFVIKEVDESHVSMEIPQV